jgi:uncharacterized MAPEG superfamily protein
MEMTEFKAGQRFIAVASPLAMLGTGIALWLAWRGIDLPQAATPDGRLRMGAMSAVMLAALLFALIGTIANLRFFSPQGIDPLEQEQDRRIVVLGRILQNTLEQAVVFALLVAAAAVVGESAARMVPGASVAFLLGRVLFAGGYLIGWRYRAPGMGMTVAANAGMLIAVGAAL